MTIAEQRIADQYEQPRTRCEECGCIIRVGQGRDTEDDSICLSCLDDRRPD